MFLLQILRIIPALAGNTVASVGGEGITADHPRTRGEHHSFCRTFGHHGGSSPHSRGTLFPCFTGFKRVGIIPALAGNTPRKTHLRCILQDHPRTRGEHVRQVDPDAIGIGSSPHSRGTQILNRDKIGKNGIIPALAGNTGFQQHGKQ